jgi:HK97 gp10 family phage protein
MSDQFTVNLRGIAEFNRALFSFSDRLGERVTKLALRQGANFMLKNIRAAAPKKTGRLRRAIKIKNSKINRIRSNGKVGLFITISPGKSRIDPKGAYYGPFQEYGYTASGTTKAREVTTSVTTVAQREAHKQRTGRRLRVYAHAPGARKIPGKRFVRNTFNATKDQAAQLIVSASEVAAQRLAQEIGFNASSS